VYQCLHGSPGPRVASSIPRRRSSTACCRYALKCELPAISLHDVIVCLGTLLQPTPDGHCRAATKSSRYGTSGSRSGAAGGRVGSDASPNTQSDPTACPALQRPCVCDLPVMQLGQVAITVSANDPIAWEERRVSHEQQVMTNSLTPPLCRTRTRIREPDVCHTSHSWKVAPAWSIFAAVLDGQRRDAQMHRNGVQAILIQALQSGFSPPAARSCSFFASDAALSYPVDEHFSRARGCAHPVHTRFRVLYDLRGHHARRCSGGFRPTQERDRWCPSDINTALRCS